MSYEAFRITYQSSEQAARALYAEVARLQAAAERANRLAAIAAEDLILTEGEPTAAPDEYAIAACQADDHMRECIAHLCASGKAMSHETDDGYIVVTFIEAY